MGDHEQPSVGGDGPQRRGIAAPRADTSTRVAVAGVVCSGFQANMSSQRCGV